MELMEKTLGPEHPATLISMNNLAEILRNQSKYEAAEEMHGLDKTKGAAERVAHLVVRCC